MSRKPRPQSTKPTHRPVTLGRGAPGAGRRAAGAAVAAGARAVRRRLGAPRRRARARRDARGVDPPPPRGEGRPRARSRTSSRSRPTATRAGTRSSGRSRPPTSASCRSASTRRCRPTRAGTRSTTFPPTAFDHGAIIHSARDRLRGKLSYSNIGFALAPATFTLNELRDVYAAALGYDVSATNLKRVLSAAARSCRPAAAATRAAPAGGPPRSSPSPAGARDHRPVRRPAPAGHARALGRLTAVELRTRLAVRVVERLGRHLALDPLAEDLDGDARADVRVGGGQVRVGDRALDRVAVAAARDPADEPVADAHGLGAERHRARIVERRGSGGRCSGSGRADAARPGRGTSPLSSLTAKPRPAANGESSGVMSAPQTR